MDDAVFYDETLRDLGVADPLAGESEADQDLRETSARWEESRRALQEVATRDWETKRPVMPTGTQKRKGRRHG